MCFCTKICPRPALAASRPHPGRSRPALVFLVPPLDNRGRCDLFTEGKSLVKITYSEKRSRPTLLFRDVNTVSVVVFHNGNSPFRFQKCQISKKVFWKYLVTFKSFVEAFF